MKIYIIRQDYEPYILIVYSFINYAFIINSLLNLQYLEENN